MADNLVHFPTPPTAPPNFLELIATVEQQRAEIGLLRAQCEGHTATVAALGTTAQRQAEEVLALLLMVRAQRRRRFWWGFTLGCIVATCIAWVF